MESLNGIPHYFINHRSIQDPYNTGDYEREALSLLNDLFVDLNVVIAVGGTGLYIKALTKGLDAFPPVPAEIKVELNQIHLKQGIEPIQEELLKLDPEYAQSVDMNNPHRLIRALSVIRASGKKYSFFTGKTADKRSFQSIMIALELPREELYEKIDARVDKMIARGLVDEVKLLHRFRDLNSLNTVGYKEIFDHLESNTSLEEAISKIKQHSRNYAKRQITWFKNQQDFTHFHPADLEGILTFIRQEMKTHSDSIKGNDK